MRAHRNAMKIARGATAATITFVGMFAALPNAEAQRFGGYFYTTQQQVQLRGVVRVCNMMGFDFATYNQQRSRVVDVRLSRAQQCQSQQARLNGDCCAVFYRNGVTRTGHTYAPRHSTAAPLQ